MALTYTEAQAQAQRTYRQSAKGKAKLSELRKAPSQRAYQVRKNQEWKARHPVKALLFAARARAKSKGLEFALTETDFPNPPTHCPVFGFELRYPGTQAGKVNPQSATLDRVDSSKGYVPGNVEIISWRANKIKSDATLAELEALVSWLKEK